MYKELTQAEREDYLKWVDEDMETVSFIRKAKLWHPVIREEICKRLK